VSDTISYEDCIKNFQDLEDYIYKLGKITEKREQIELINDILDAREERRKNLKLEEYWELPGESKAMDNK
jgi:hypothetical protein